MEELQNTYITFGFDHSHVIGETTFDKDCVAMIENVTPAEGREVAFRLFGDKFCMEYPAEFFPWSSLAKYFYRGIIKIT